MQIEVSSKEDDAFKIWTKRPTDWLQSCRRDEVSGGTAQAAVGSTINLDLLRGGRQLSSVSIFLISWFSQRCSTVLIVSKLTPVKVCSAILSARITHTNYSSHVDNCCLNFFFLSVLGLKFSLRISTSLNVLNVLKLPLLKLFFEKVGKPPRE